MRRLATLAVTMSLSLSAGIHPDTVLAQPAQPLPRRPKARGN
jgi:hypothetical protein